MAVDRFGVRKKLLGQVLKEMKVIHEGQVQEALGVQKKEGGQIGQILVRLGHITEGQLSLALGRQSGMEVVDLNQLQPQKEAVEKVDEALLEAVESGEYYALDDFADLRYERQGQSLHPH